MKKHVLFSEIQNQTMKWIWFLLLIIAIVLIFGAVQQIIFHKPFGTHPVPDWAFIPMFAIVGLFLVLLATSKLKTEITDEYISFQFKPFISREKVIKWEDVDKCYVRVYSPVKEFGGWGWRTTFTRHGGIAYNVSGKIGIQLELKNGRNILIGTRRGKEVEEVLKSIKSIKS